MKTTLKIDFRNPPKLKTLEGEMIVGVLALNGWNVSEAAEALGVDRRTIQRRLYLKKKRPRNRR